MADVQQAMTSRAYSTSRNVSGSTVSSQFDGSEGSASASPASSGPTTPPPPPAPSVPASAADMRSKPRSYSSNVPGVVQPVASQNSGNATPTNSSNSNVHVIPRPPKPTNKPRSRSFTPRSKLRQPSFSNDPPANKPLSTHSPIAVAAAAAVTSDKIRKLLVSQGPLPIRHITSHLASTIPGFGELSLSKQRRLIIAVLDAPKSEFVKVGWGRWAVRGFGTDNKDSFSNSGSGSTSSSNRNSTNLARLSQINAGVHRESISRHLPDSKPPLSPSLGPVEDSAVFSDSESSDRFDDDSEVEGTDEEDWQAIGPTQLRQTSPREQDAIAALVQLRSN